MVPLVRINAINFTIEHEKDGQIAFLDTLISRHNNSISINVYRKPTHTDRYLDYSSHHDNRHKISAATTLINRSLNLPSISEEGKVRELNHVNEPLTANGYPQRLVSRLIQEQKSNSIPCPEDLEERFLNLWNLQSHHLDMRFYLTLKASRRTPHESSSKARY